MMVESVPDTKKAQNRRRLPSMWKPSLYPPRLERMIRTQTIAAILRLETFFIPPSEVYTTNVNMYVTVLSQCVEPLNDHICLCMPRYLILL